MSAAIGSGPEASTCVQRCAVEQLHHQIRSPLVGADIEEGADVRVIECRDGAPLSLEPRQRVG